MSQTEAHHAIEPLTTVEVSCSWCHAMNDIRVRDCSGCGHRATVPRSACDCAACTTPQPPATKSEYEKAIEWLEARTRR